MAKKHFVLKLLSPRPTFPQDITSDEQAIMKEHAIYWRERMDEGKVIAFGPVLDPRGAYGLAIIAVDTDEEPGKLIELDPACQISSYEIYPMMAVTRDTPR